MAQATHNKIVALLWGIAADVLRDLFKRDKHPDVILPMRPPPPLRRHRTPAEPCFSKTAP